MGAVKKTLLALWLCLLPSWAWANANCTYTFPDFSTAQRTVNAYCDNSSQIWPMYIPIDSNGNAVWGTAGAANSNVMTVQGIASATPIVENQTQINGVAISTGTGAQNSGSQRVAVAGDSSVWAGVAPGTAGAPATQVMSVQGVSGGTAVPVSSNDPCTYGLKKTADFSSTTSGGSLITAVAAQKAYICSITMVTSQPANVSLIEGTGASVCTGGTPAGVYLNTGTTAANGAAFAANGGVSIGGTNTIAQNATANQNICVAFTTTNAPQVNAHVSYVQQ